MERGMTDEAGGHSTRYGDIKKSSMFNQQAGRLDVPEAWHDALFHRRNEDNLSTETLSAVHGHDSDSSLLRCSRGDRDT
jgi:hypothetical protein